MSESTEAALSKPLLSVQNFLKPNKIYIIPNRFGLLYMVVIIIMVLTGATYSNNLIYLLGFFLFSVFVSGMVQTHINLNGVSVQVSSIDDAYEGEVVRVHLAFKNQTKKTKQTLRAQLPRDNEYRMEIPAKVDIVEAHKTVYSSLEVNHHKRGVYNALRLKVYTNFPMGLFVSWMYQGSEKEYFIYPRPENFSGSEYQRMGESQELRVGKTADKKADSDFREHKEYRQGESYRHIDWKAYARKRPLLVKTFEGETGIQKVFDYSKLTHLNPEERLRQLSFWITESLRANENFQLILPYERTGMSDGLTHAKKCLRSLATFSKNKGMKREG